MISEEIMELIEKDAMSNELKHHQTGRRNRLIEYYKNPNKCQHCNAIIMISFREKISSTREKKFCNHGCAASYNNKNRKQKEYFCVKCDKSIGIGHAEFGRKKLCDDCNTINVDWSKITLAEIIQKASYQAHSRIRKLARAKTRNLRRFNQCSNCGYNKHVEVCHIKSIDSFDSETTIDIINDLHNLVGLCPNCHWELDNGFLILDDNWIKD